MPRKFVTGALCATLAFVSLQFAMPAVNADSVNQLASWGYGGSGALGNGSTTNSPVPVNVTTSGVLDGKTIAKISAGSTHSCVLDTGGLAYCWGTNTNGQLGNGNRTSSNVPVAVTLPSGVTFDSISAGEDHTCAIASTSGAAYCWGYGGHGELGNGSIPPDPFSVTTPVAVTMPSGKSFRSISAGNRFTCAVTTDNLGYCWGTGGNGQTGTGAPTQTLVPTAVTGGHSFSVIVAGSITTCGITTTGAALCWGYGYYGQLGNNTQITTQLSPAAVDTSSGRPSSYSSISLNVQSEHVCAVASDSSVWCWGSNSSGQLGVPLTTTRSLVPIQVISGSTQFNNVHVGASFTCALTLANSVQCWGSNSSGQLGNNTAPTDSDTPVAVATSGVLLNSRVSQLATGSGTAVVLATTPPSAPRTLSATAGIESAVISWTAPVSTGGETITGYTVTSSPDGRTCSVSTTSCTITGLTGGTSYTFTAVATNARGNSVSSNASNAVTPTANNSGGGGSSSPEVTPSPSSSTSSNPAAAPIQSAGNTSATPTIQGIAISNLAVGNIRMLTPSDLKSIPASEFRTASRATMSLFSAAQMRALSRAQLRAISPFAFKGVAPTALRGMTVKQFTGLTSKQKSALTTEQRDALTDKQRTALEPKTRR